MRGAVAHAAEVVGRADDAGAQMVMPDPIDDDAAGQRMMGSTQPSSEGQVTTGSVTDRSQGDVGRAGSRTSRKVRFDCLTRPEIAAGR